MDKKKYLRSIFEAQRVMDKLMPGRITITEKELEEVITDELEKPKGTEDLELIYYCVDMISILRKKKVVERLAKQSSGYHSIIISYLVYTGDDGRRIRANYTPRFDNAALDRKVKKALKNMLAGRYTDRKCPFTIVDFK